MPPSRAKFVGIYGCIPIVQCTIRIFPAFIYPSTEAIRSTGGFISLRSTPRFNSYLLILSLDLIIIGILNLLPLPGFSIGNAIISSFEISRKKYFKKARKYILSLISIIIVILFVFLNDIFFYL